jgi:hypothetical protein
MAGNAILGGIAPTRDSVPVASTNVTHISKNVTTHLRP